MVSNTIAASKKVETIVEPASGGVSETKIQSQNIVESWCGKKDERYAKYVLIVLVIVSVLNFMDRSIIGILVEDIKADLSLSDTQVGFLGGTAFTVFYATFGVALGRLADVWNRKKLITAGLSIWSALTALSGLARGFIPLAGCRFGVGVGEACASPAVYSMLYDYFSPKTRTTVMAIYLCGASIGGGLGIILGGAIVNQWHSIWPNSEFAPFGLSGWQAALIMVGLPGVLVALWVSTLREPIRGSKDGIISTPNKYPFRELFAVLMSMVPVVNCWVFYRSDAKGKLFVTNFILAVMTIAATGMLAAVTGDYLQWIALAVGIYAAGSYTQLLSVRDPVIFGLIANCKTFRSIIIGDSLISFNIGITFWVIPYILRYYNASAIDVGSVLGAGNIAVGIAGTLLGGVLGDFLRRKNGRGKLLVYLCGAIVSTLCLFSLLCLNNLTASYIAAMMAAFAGGMSISPIMSTVNDLMLPRGRATVMGIYIMITLLSGAALGPYIVGYISDSLTVRGMVSREALRVGMLCGLVMPMIGFLFIRRAIMSVERDESSLVKRAQELGETI